MKKRTVPIWIFWDWAIESVGVAIHGQSFVSGAVWTDLAADYPEPRASLLNIGVLHTALTGRGEHQPYAPTTADRLTDKGYDYWALGHAHTREIVQEIVRGIALDSISW